MARKEYTPGGNLTQAFVDLLDAGNAQAQLIMKAIAQHADWETGEAFPGVRSLAEIGKCSAKTVRRYLRRLEGDGLIFLDERYQDGADENGRQTTSRITLVGYAEWAAANRKGGTVRKPPKVTKYEGPPPGQDDQGGGGTLGEPEATPLDSLTTAPLDNLSAPPGHMESTPPGQQGDQGKNLHSNQEDNSPPLPPKRAKRARGARGRERDNPAQDVETLIAGLRKEPDWADAVTLLIEPILRQRKFLAPDPAYVLGDLAGWAVQFSRETLKAALFKVLETRYTAVEGEHIVAALTQVAAASGKMPVLRRPSARATVADGLLTITEREQPDAFAAWAVYHAGLQKQRQPNKMPLLSQHRFLREATLYPPGTAASTTGDSAKIGRGCDR